MTGDGAKQIVEVEREMDMIVQSREEHLSWCKSRALGILDSGDREGACASMVSDLGKWREPLYDKMTLTMLMMDAILFRKTSAEMRHWIEGFN